MREGGEEGAAGGGGREGRERMNVNMILQNFLGTFL